MKILCENCNHESEILNVKESADVLGLHHKSLQRLIDDDFPIPSMKTANGIRYFYRVDIETAKENKLFKPRKKRGVNL